VYRNINIIPSGTTLADGRPIFGSGRIDPRFNSVLMAESVGISNYNALNVQLQRRFARGYDFFASYTWAHAIDDAPEQNVLDTYTGTNSSNIFPSDPTNRSRDRGNSFTDRRHTFTASAVLEPTVGVSKRGLNYIANHNRLALMVVARGGDPINEGSNLNLNNDPSIPAALQRPLYIGRNTLRGPNVYQIDARYSRIFPIGERWKPEFFAEAWNLFNHSNFSGSGNSLNSIATVNSAGVILTQPTLQPINALDPRLLQLGIKLSF